MGTLAPSTEDDWPREAFTPQQITDKLAYWSEHLREKDQGLSNAALTRAEIVTNLNRWLDELTEQRGL